MSNNPFGIFKSAVSTTPSHSDDASSSSSAHMSASDLLMGAYDPSKLHPLADIGDKLDYLLLDDDKNLSTEGEAPLPSRGWSDHLCYTH